MSTFCTSALCLQREWAVGVRLPPSNGHPESKREQFINFSSFYINGDGDIHDVDWRLESCKEDYVFFVKKLEIAACFMFALDVVVVSVFLFFAAGFFTDSSPDSDSSEPIAVLARKLGFNRIAVEEEEELCGFSFSA